MTEYLVRTNRVRQLWIPYGGFMFPPPRLIQIGKIVHCIIFGHDWRPWVMDDYEGPGQFLNSDPDSFMPFCSRQSRSGEYGTRHCQYCRLGQERWPVDQHIPPLFKGELIEMED